MSVDGRINILFAIPNFITAGSGREMFNIIERLDKKIFNPAIVVQQSGGILYDEIVNKGYNIITAPFIAATGNPVLNIYTAVKNALIFRKYKIDIWQSFNWSSDFTEAITARLVGAKYVYVKKNMNWGRKAWRIKSFLSNAIVLRNTSLVNILSTTSLKNKIHFITGGVDTLKFRPGRQIHSSGLKVCCIAQFVRLKGQDCLIKAVARLQNITLVLAGSFRDNQYKKELEQLIDELGVHNRVSMVSYTPSETLLNSADIFVLPTNRLHGHEEGCPVALLEAMATGIPSIASKVAGNIDLIQHNATGLLFEPDNVEDLTAQLSLLQSDKNLPSTLGLAARNKVLAGHTLDIEAAAFSDLYLRLVKKR